MTFPLNQPQTFVTHDGLTLTYYQLADGQEGPPLLLQHGFTAEVMVEWVTCGIVDRLAPLNRPIFGLDARGHGKSDRPHDPARYGEDNMAEDALALTRHLGWESFDFCGYSMGGITAILLGTKPSNLRRLVVSGVGEGVVACGGVDQRAFTRAELARCLRAEDPTPFHETMRNWRQTIDERGGDLMAMAAVADSVHATPIPLNKITAQTMLLVGDVDPLAVKPEVLANEIADCRLEIIPGDHTSARLHVAFTDKLLDFLA